MKKYIVYFILGILFAIITNLFLPYVTQPFMENSNFLRLSVLSVQPTIFAISGIIFLILIMIVDYLLKNNQLSTAKAIYKILYFVIGFAIVTLIVLWPNFAFYLYR